MTKKFRLFCLSILTSLFINPNIAFAIDTSDTTPPVVTYKLLQDLPSRGNLVVFEVVVTDDKNEIVVQGGRIYAAVLYTYDPSKLQVAPICQFGGQTDFVMQLIPRQATSIKLPDGRFQATFDLLMYMARPGDMPSGCPDWRQGAGYIYTNVEGIRDAAGNRVRIVPSDSARRPEFSVSPFAPIVDKLSLAESKHYCFNAAFGEWEQGYLQRLLATYREGIKPHIGKNYSKEILAEFDKKFPKFELIAQQYLMVGKSALTLENLNKLETCQWFVRPWTEDFQATLAEFSKALSSASAASSTTTSKRITITCTKGKLVKKVSGVNPKCPSGYRKK